MFDPRCQTGARVKLWTCHLSAALAAFLLGSAGLATAQEKLAFGSDDTLEQIRAKIQHNGYSFTVAHNWVFDLSAGEKARLFPPRPEVPLENRITPPPTDLIFKTPAPSALPAKFDWRDQDGHSYIGPIRNQGIIGTCYAFGAVAAAESAYNIQNGLCDDQCADLSEMYVVWTLGLVEPYGGNYNDGRGTGSNAFKYELYAMTRSGAPEKAVGFEGVCFESDFPYVPNPFPPKAEVLKKSKAFPRVIFKSWTRVFPSDYADTTEQIKAAIVQYGCVQAGIHHNAAFNAYQSGVYEDTDTQPDASPYYRGTDINHVVSLVGWDDHPPEGGGGCWILRNEWGTGWGENGYMRIRYFSAQVNTQAAWIELGSPVQIQAIRGKIPSGHNPDLTLSLTGAATAVATVNSNNQYILAGLADGEYTVTPSCPGNVFTPASRQVTLHGKDVSGCDFTFAQTGASLTMAVSPANAGSTYPLAGQETVPANAWLYVSASPANTRYAFSAWALSGAATLESPATTSVNRVRLSGAATLTAVFDSLPPPATVTLGMVYNPDDEGCSMIPAPGNHPVPYDAPVEVRAIPGPGYCFTGWSVKGPGTVTDPCSLATTVILQGDAEVTPGFGKTSYQLTMDMAPTGAGSVTPAPGAHAVAAETEIEIQADPADGYFFDKWVWVGTIGHVKVKGEYDPQTTVFLACDALVTADFKKIDQTATLALSVDAAERGATRPAVGAHTVPVGARNWIEAVPAPGYFFANWTVSGKGKITDPRSARTAVVLSGDAVATASFAKMVTTATLTMAVAQYNTACTTNPGEGEHIVAAGAWTEIEASPADGYHFVNWTVAGDADIKNPFAEQTEVALIGNATLTANFALSPVAFVSLGSMLTVSASEADPAAPAFTKTPSLWAVYLDPVQLKGGLKAPLSLLARISPKTPQPTVSATWNKPIPLYDSSLYWTKTTPASGNILGDPMPSLFMDSVMLKSPQFGRSALEIPGRSLALACPFISRIDGDYGAAGDPFTVSGMFFGAKAPRLYVECERTSGGRKTYAYLPCRIVRTGTYLYQDAKGRAKASCMRIRNDDPTDGPVGWSVVTAIYPNVGRAVPTGYLILDNQIGLAAAAFP